MTVLQEQFTQILGADRVLVGEPMAAHTSFRVGGPADYYVQVASAEELIAVIDACKAAGEPYYLLGKGTNLLVSDKGYRGCVITQVSRESVPVTDTAEEEKEIGTLTALNEVHVDSLACTITAGAGASLARVAAVARDHGLAGLEFAAGIPGSVGGGIVMNAGAYGGEMKDVVTSVAILLPDGTRRTLTAEEMQFGYRDSIVRHPERLIGGTNLDADTMVIVLGCAMRLTPDDPAAISARMQDLAARRRDKQPLEYPSAGSTFKRPEGYYAGKLIMDAGLKGYRVGGACVSTKHAGFVVNVDHATCADVLAVIHDVQDKVYEQNQIRLETEVIYLGED